jgi:hypothetical protein
MVTILAVSTPGFKKQINDGECGVAAFCVIEERI